MVGVVDSSRVLDSNASSTVLLFLLSIPFALSFSKSPLVPSSLSSYNVPVTRHPSPVARRPSLLPFLISVRPGLAQELADSDGPR
ncbi:hypothetical protein F5X97DRAFT_326187 [Nemania serpens]|nr:hypothetical protein F5X97DRAFT_326187 [Nemania serpens]